MALCYPGWWDGLKAAGVTFLQAAVWNGVLRRVKVVRVP
jgi:hypothetical protein